MSRHKRASEQSNRIGELAHRRVAAVLACLKVLCPSADRSTQQRLTTEILTLVRGDDRPIPRFMITPAAAYEIFTRNSQCVLNQTGRCPLLVFAKQLCEELNSFFQGGLMNQMEAAQRTFLDAQRRWNADEKGDFRLLEVCSDAEQQLLAAFFDGWKANMRFKNLVYSHFRKALIENDIKLMWCAASKDIA